MSKENTNIVIAEKGGKIRNFSKATWDLLPADKMGYSIVKDLPELNTDKAEAAKAKAEAKAAAKAEAEKAKAEKNAKGEKPAAKEKHDAFKKKADTEEKPEESKSEETPNVDGGSEAENFTAVDPLKDQVI